ncbi:GbpC/Spa domain-containing protein [Streptococcus suis]|uniref:GbpC/Spa domain-containing protein n=2 Tax=Streptococcus suis TaxID=1307 RepID=UPI000CF6CC33|nr:GbpC/Spa domain-containing protein [Streptococcus suis]
MEQKQRFSIRKFKNGVGSALLLSLLLAPIALQTTVLAQDAENPTQQQLGNATNYTTAQADPSEEFLASEKLANTSQGEIINQITSTELTAAISEAKNAGVKVTVDKGVNFDSLEAGQADYANQVTAVKAIIDKQVVAQKTYEEAEKKYQAYLVAEAQYEKDNTAYQAYLTAKAEYDKAFASYQEAYKVYETALAENVKLVAQYEKDKQAYDKAYTLYQEALKKHTDVTAVNAKKKADYEAALTKYNQDYANYQAALATYTAASTENARLKAAYDAAKAEYDKKKAEYDTAKAAYDKQVAEANRRAGMKGYIPELLNKYLIFENDWTKSAQVSVVANTYIDEVQAKKELNFNGDIPKLLRSAELSKFTTSTPSKMVQLKPGEQLVATYTNLTASYNDKLVTKAVFTFKLDSDNGVMNMLVLDDPSETINVGSPNPLKKDSKIDTTVELFFEDGTKVLPQKDKPFVYSVASLNSNGLDHIEYVSNLGAGSRFVGINGSYVSNHGGEIYSASDIDYGSGTGVHTDDWDYATSPNAYYGAGVVVATEDIKFSFGVKGESLTSQWFAFNTNLKTSILPKPPIAPTAPTPPKYKVTGNNPEEPVKPTEPTYEDTTAPTPPVEPTKPIIVEPVKPTEPTKPTEVPKPGTVDEVPIPTVPAQLEVKVHPNTYSSHPTIQKEVTNDAGEDLSNALVPKGSTVKFPLQLPTLTAGRPEYKVLTVEDNIPEGYDLNVEAAKTAFPEFDVTYDEKTRLFKLVSKEELVAAINKDRTKEFTFAKQALTGIVTNDGTVYKNTFKVSLDNSYTIYSNTVKVTTPGKPNDPDNPDNNLIQPTKQVVDAEGKDIDGQAVGLKDTLNYPLFWDMDQYNTIKDGDSAKDIYFYFDLYDASKVTVDLEASKEVVDENSQVSSDIEVTNYASFADLPKELQTAFENANLKEVVGNKSILLYLPKDMAAFEENYVKKGISLNLKFVATPKREAAGQVIENTAGQVDFGNGYITNTVTNKVQVTTEWEDKPGTVLKDKVTGDQTEEAGSFDHYRFVETQETETGIKHIFEKLYTTEWVDEQGNALKEKVEDTETKEHGTIERYEYVRTEDTPTGIKHIFKRIVEQPVQPKKNLPLTGEQATIGLVGLGAALLALILAWKFKLVEKLKKVFKK